MAGPESAEKMQVVVDSLRSDPDVVVVGGVERNSLQTGTHPRPNGYWSRTLDIYTHPTDPIYDADELNDFMFGLVPEMKPTASDRFHGWDSELALGRLYYDEVIGTVATASVVKLKDGLSVVKSGILAPEWTAGSPETTEDLRQRTWVRVFPDAGHVADAAEGHNEYTIPRFELGRSEARVVPRLLDSPTLGQVIEVKAIEQ